MSKKIYEAKEYIFNIFLKNSESKKNIIINSNARKSLGFGRAVRKNVDLYFDLSNPEKIVDTQVRETSSFRYSYQNKTSLFENVVGEYKKTTFVQSLKRKELLDIADRFRIFLGKKNITSKDALFFKTYALKAFPEMYIRVFDYLKDKEKKDNLAKIFVSQLMRDMESISFGDLVKETFEVEKYYLFLDKTFLFNLFENGIIYLTDKKFYTRNIDDDLIDIPEAIKSFLLDFLKEDKEALKCLIHREIFKFNNSENEVFEIISLFKENISPKTFQNLISSNRFVRKEYSFMKNLLINELDVDVNNLILKKLKRIKSPTEKTKILISYIQKRLPNLVASENKENILNESFLELKAYMFSYPIVEDGYLSEKNINFLSRNFKLLNKAELQELNIFELNIYQSNVDKKNILNICFIVIPHPKLTECFYREIIRKFFCKMDKIYQKENIEELYFSLKEERLSLIINKDEEKTKMSRQKI